VLRPIKVIANQLRNNYYYCHIDTQIADGERGSRTSAFSTRSMPKTALPTQGQGRRNRKKAQDGREK
jgi:hypothetical protein